MHRSCTTCKYIKSGVRIIDTTGRTMNVHECTEDNAKRANNGHTPTVEFARNDHFGVCGSVGLLHVEKDTTPAAAGVDYHAKRMEARARVQSQLFD